MIQLKGGASGKYDPTILPQQYQCPRWINDGASQNMPTLVEVKRSTFKQLTETLRNFFFSRFFFERK